MAAWRLMRSTSHRRSAAPVPGPSCRVLLLAALVLATAAPADGADGGEAPSHRLGLRLGAQSMLSSSDRFDAVFGGTAPLVGVDFELAFERWSLRFGAHRSSWDGEEALVVRRELEADEGPFLSRSTLTATGADFTVARRFSLGATWEGIAGAGPSVLAWKDDNLLRVREGSDWGAHLLFGARRPVGSWTLGAELVVTRVSGVSDDLGGDQGRSIREDLDLVQVDFTASRRVWPVATSSGAAAPRPERRARPDRVALRLTAVGVHPTYSYSRSFGKYGPTGGTLDSQQDDDVGWGTGLTFGLGGPWTLTLTWFEATVGTSSTVTTRRPEGDYVLAASGELDVEGATLAAGLDLWRRGRARVSAGPLVAYLSYTGMEDGEYRIGIDRDGVNLGAFVALDLEEVAGGLGFVVELAHLSLARVDGFESGFELDPLLLSAGVRYGWGRR